MATHPPVALEALAEEGGEILVVGDQILPAEVLLVEAAVEAGGPEALQIAGENGGLGGQLGAAEFIGAAGLPAADIPAAAILEGEEEEGGQIAEGAVNDDLPELEHFAAADIMEAAAMPAAGPGGISYGDLLGMNKTGLYKTHPTWLTPCNTIVQALLNQVMEADEDMSLQGVVAFLLFPGLIEYCRNCRGEVLTSIAFLRCVSAHPDKAGEIIRWAKLWAIRRNNRAFEWGEANSESIRQRIEGYIKDGRLSLATKTLTILDKLLTGLALPVGMGQEQMQERVAELHPAADYRDILPDESEDPSIDETVVITPHQLRDRIYTLNLDSGAGSSAWTNRFLRFIGEDRDFNLPHVLVGGIAPNDLHRALTEFANRIFRGEFHGEARELLNTARLIMVTKEDGGERPVTIHCAVQRFFGSLAGNTGRSLLGDYLRPIQLGGGYKSGAEIIAREMAAAYQEGDVIMKVDIANAFNTARRRHMFEQVRDKVPGLARYFRFQYGRESILRGNQGTVIGRSATGVGQGHPCSSLYFELGIHTALLELAAMVAEIEAEHDIIAPDNKVGRKGSVSAYEDDTLVRGEAAIMKQVGPLIAPHLATHGYCVKIPKSKITGRNTDTMEGLPAGFAIEATGFQVVGIPIGEADFCRTQVANKLARMAPPPGALATLKPRSAIQLLSKCYNPRPTYILRAVLDMAETAEAARQFDDRITEALAAALRLPVTDDLKTRIFLPQKHGGLGYTRHFGMATEKNQICSRLIHTNFVQTHHPQDAALTKIQYDMRAIRLGASEDVVEHTEIAQEDHEGMDHVTCKAILKHGKDMVEIVRHDQLHHRLRESPDNASQAAWLLSNTNGGMAFMDSRVGIAMARYFGEEEFVCAARMKLGVGPTNDHPDMIRVCRCGAAYRTGTDPFHAISCRQNNSQRTYCHTELVGLLYRLLKKRYPHAEVDKEKEVGRTAPVGGVDQGIRADIVAKIGPITYVIDVSTVDPGNASSLGLLPSSAGSQDAAGVQREKVKRRHYRRVVTPAAIPAAHMIPFVVETSGRLGPTAIAFLHTICHSQTYIRSKFLNNVVMILSTTNGKILKDTRDGLQQYP
jgi:hypothetical protein